MQLSNFSMYCKIYDKGIKKIVRRPVLPVLHLIKEGY